MTPFQKPSDLPSVSLQTKLKRYKARLNRSNKRQTAVWQTVFGKKKPKCPCCKQVLPVTSEGKRRMKAASKAADAEKLVIVREMLADDTVKHLICTESASFWPRELEHDLAKRFRLLVLDSVDDMGVAYYPTAIKQQVSDWLVQRTGEIVFGKATDLFIQWNYKGKK